MIYVDGRGFSVFIWVLGLVTEIAEGGKDLWRSPSSNLSLKQSTSTGCSGPCPVGLDISMDGGNLSRQLAPVFMLVNCK